MYICICMRYSYHTYTYIYVYIDTHQHIYISSVWCVHLYTDILETTRLGVLGLEPNDGSHGSRSIHLNWFEIMVLMICYICLSFVLDSEAGNQNPDSPLKSTPAADLLGPWTPQRHPKENRVIKNMISNQFK